MKTNGLGVRTAAKGSDTIRRVKKSTMLQLREAMRENIKEAEPREIILGRALRSGQPISMDDVTTYIADRDEGVIPGTDIRTDRFEVARKATAEMSQRQIEKRNPARKIAGDTGDVAGTPDGSQK